MIKTPVVSPVLLGVVMISIFPVHEIIQAKLCKCAGIGKAENSHPPKASKRDLSVLNPIPFDPFYRVARRNPILC
jgi:hypothetical protein